MSPKETIEDVLRRRLLCVEHVSEHNKPVLYLVSVLPLRYDSIIVATLLRLPHVVH